MNTYPTRALKSATFRYSASSDLTPLFEGFRLMCNDSIRLAVETKPRNKFELITLAYSRLKEYGLHSHYILSACEVAFSLFKNKRRFKIPVIRKAFVKLDNQSYRIDHLILRIPLTPRHFVFLSLEGTRQNLPFIENRLLRRGTVTITPEAVNIAFSKEVQVSEPTGFMGLDVNERNVTVSATDGYQRTFTELAEIVEIKERYRGIRARIEKQVRRDARIRKLLLSKFGRRERNRTAQRIHTVTRQVVNYARSHDFGIKMERLTGIRRRYRKGNGIGPNSGEE